MPHLESGSGLFIKLNTLACEPETISHPRPRFSSTTVFCSGRWNQSSQPGKLLDLQVGQIPGYMSDHTFTLLTAL